jgi:hypothetical protein
MAAGSELHSGDFARYPDIVELGIQKFTDAGVEFGDREQLSLGFQA